MSAPTPAGAPQPGQPYSTPQHPGQPYPQGYSTPQHPGQPYPQGYPTQGAQPGVPTPPRRSWFARHKFLTGVGVVAVLGIVGSALGGGGDDEPATPTTGAEAPAEDTASGSETDTTEADAAVAEDPAEEPVEEPAAGAGVGDAVRDGKFEFTVTEVETGVASVGDDFLAQEAQGQYVLVHMTVENIGDEAQLFDGSSQELTDTEGRTHENDGSAAIYLDDSNSFLTEINPGNSVDGVVVFDIPADATPASIELHDSMFSGGVEVTVEPGNG